MIGKERKLEYDILCTNRNIVKVSPKDEHTSTTCVSNKGEVINARSLQFKLKGCMTYQLSIEGGALAPDEK